MKKKFRYEPPVLFCITDRPLAEGACTNGADTAGCSTGSMVAGYKCQTGSGTAMCYGGSKAGGSSTCWCCQAGSPNWFPYSCLCSTGSDTAGTCNTGSKTDGTCSTGSSAYGWCKYN